LPEGQQTGGGSHYKMAGNRRGKTTASPVRGDPRMKKLLALAIVGAFAVAANPAFANAQQDRMKVCNAKAADKKGDERKKFMSDCLAAEKVSQQDKMKACNTKAGDKKGDERKAFMSQCLKG
jgi:hypothetical protein